MTILDIYYRAFKEYRKETADNTTCEKDRKAIATAGLDDDKLSATKYLCKIDEDWIVAIEEGLEYVEKACGEERQFIRQDGEVVPIEKVRKISNDSVKHLAKHSDLITRMDEDKDDIVPDALYMVEKLADYAVYENRFLYMMLCYLRNFITYRLENIEKLRRTYLGDMSINKKILTKNRTLTIEMSVKEERTDNPFPIADDKSASLLKRIDDCRQIIDALLNTDLMTQVAKSPMIKPPIVKTNVLKMNNNFKRALALYDYIAGYSGDGYTFEEVKFNYSPFEDKVADEIAECANLVAFTSYKIGNDIESHLELEYKQEENRRKVEEEKKADLRLKRLKKRATESEKTFEEYMLVLEEYCKSLEKDSQELATIHQEMEALTRQVEQLNDEKRELHRQQDELKAEIEQKELEIATLNQKYLEDMAAAKAAHERSISEMVASQEAAINAAKAQLADQMSQTLTDYETRCGELQTQVASLNAAYQQVSADCEQRLSEMQYKMQHFDELEQKYRDECEKKMNSIENSAATTISKMERQHDKEVAELQQKLSLARGELDGIRAEQGKLVPSDEYTNRERFKELESEYLAFQNFFKKQWQYTKKEIRKTILWTKQDKKKN